MRVFLDSNVLIAAALSDGNFWRFLNRIIETHDAVTSEEAFAETSRKLIGKLHQSRADVEQYTSLLRQKILVLPAQVAPPKVSRDPKDDWVLAAAQAGACHCILTGDGDLTVLKKHKGIVILRPRDFLAFEAARFKRRKWA